jgi:hypothetical protein
MTAIVAAFASSALAFGAQPPVGQVNAAPSIEVPQPAEPVPPAFLPQPSQDDAATPRVASAAGAPNVCPNIGRDGANRPGEPRVPAAAPAFADDQLPDCSIAH